MKQNFSDIRQILAQWYEGQTTPEQEQWLIDTFGTLAPESVPHDLKPDYAIFAGLQPEVTVTEAEAEHAVDTAIHSSSRLSHRLWRARIAAAVAAVIIIAGALTLAPTSSLTTARQESLQLADAHNAADAQASHIPSPEEAMASLAQSVASHRQSFTKFLAAFTSLGKNSVTPSNHLAVAHKETKASRATRCDAPEGYVTPSPQQASEIVSDSWQLMATLMRTTVEDASATTEAATRSASDDIQNAISTGHAGLEQFQDITANIINSI